MKKKLAAAFLVVGLGGGGALAGTAGAAPKSDPANCVGSVVSLHTSLGVTKGSGAKALVGAAKDSCRNGVSFHS